MKKVILFILTITLTLVLFSCSSDVGGSYDTSIPQSEENSGDLTAQNSTISLNEPNTTSFYNSMSSDDIGVSYVTSIPQSEEKSSDLTTQNSTISLNEPNTTPFHNPISPDDIPDPFITYDPETEYYYALFTQVNRLEIFRSKQAANVFTDHDTNVIYIACGSHGIYGDIWAPEMHRGTDGLWYIYTSGRITETAGEKRIFILGSLTSDPFGEWEYKCMPAPSVFSIDPTVYTASDGTQYMCYSRVDPNYGQVLDIARMRSPTSIYEAKTIAKAELEWELKEPNVGSSAILEGAFFLENNGRLFLIYSANGCWNNHYALGVLEYKGGDMCSPESWKKHPEPLLVQGNNVYGPGHASFFRSPDNSEVWCAYHGMRQSNETVTYAPRYCNLQKVKFDETGYPILGQPIGYETPIAPPSGEVLDEVWNRP